MTSPRSENPVVLRPRKTPSSYSNCSDRFSAESDEDNQRQVLFRFAGDAGNNASQTTTTFTLDLLTGFQAMINDPSPETANNQALQISAIR